MGGDYVVWLERPEFELIQDDHRFNKFRCFVPGRAKLSDGRVVEFEIGWVTDVTSAPTIMAIVLAQLGPHAPAALLHDKLLELGLPRKYARRWMKVQLSQLDNVKKWRKHAMYYGVYFYDVVVITIKVMLS